MRTQLPALFFALASLAFSQTTVWKLVWSDAFNQSAGTPPDPANWNYDLGGGGWGNGEAETYTNSPQNVFQDGRGNLVIRAIRDAAGNYTSTRLQTGSPGASTHTADLNWQYGRIAARIKLPFGQGVWPAFWMLGENFVTAGWPNCGELDIMENFGTFNNNAAVNNGTAHGPGYSAQNGIGKAYTLPLGQKVADNYHVYSIEWSADSVEWFVDGVSFHKITPASLPAGRQWVFNNPFFILLNLAIGGSSTFLGRPNANAPFPPQDMLVDYVRVYQAAPVADGTPVIAPGSIVNAASYLGTLAPGALASLRGSNLGDPGHTLTVSVGGYAAPLIFLSPSQINFQIPWEVPPNPAVDVKVTRDGIDSEIETITIAAAAAPSVFLSEFNSGLAWVTGEGCATTECAVQPGAIYQLWGNGFGPKNGPSQDGAPALFQGSLTPLEVPGGPAACQLTIAGQPAVAQYCGAAPGEIIDQLNFVYPSGVAASPFVDATLTIGDSTGHFRVPAPAGAHD